MRHFGASMKVRWRETGLANAELKLLRIEMTRLADSLVEAGWVRADERPSIPQKLNEYYCAPCRLTERWWTPLAGTWRLQVYPS